MLVLEIFTFSIMFIYEYVNEDNIDKVLDKAVDEIKTGIEEDQDKDSILVIHAFHFKLYNSYWRH